MEKILERRISSISGGFHFEIRVYLLLLFPSSSFTFIHAILLFFHLNKLIVYTFPHAQGNCLSLPFAILVDLLHSLLSLFLFSLSLRFSTFFLSHRKFDLLYGGRNER